MSEPEPAPQDQDQEEREPAEPRKPKNFLGFFVLVVAVVMMVGMLGKQSLTSPHKKLTTKQFLKQAEDGMIKKARVEGNRVEGEFQEGGKDKTFVVTLPPDLLVQGKRTVQIDGKPVQLTLFEYLNTKIEDFSYREANNLLYNFILQMAPWFLLFAFVYFFFFRKMNAGGAGGGVLSFGRSRAKLVSEEQISISFDDVAGIDEAKEEVQEIIEFLRHPAKFQRLGARIPRGVLLVGAPGTGKTLLAKAIAGEASVPFFSICGSDFVEMFVGVGASRVRDLFKQAKEKSPSIIFLDEMDAVGRRRGTGLGGGHDEREQTLNAILVEMDGFHTDTGVIVIAATNRPDVLDPALSRPGRFDREIQIDLPTLSGREAILRVHSRRVKLDRDVDLHVIARSTPGYSGAELEAVINEAALLAVMHEKDAVDQVELEEAREKVRFGREKKSREQDEEDRWTTAVHEAGHALVCELEEHTENLHKVSIVPRGRALGVTMMIPERERFNMPKRRLVANIRICYGGRVAEQLICDDIDGGAQQDIEQATNMIRAMVCRWGMSEMLGPVAYAGNEETMFLGREVTRNQHMSEATAQKVDSEIHRIATECFAHVEQLLGNHQQQLREIAEALLEFEVISGDEVTAIVAGEDIKEPRRAAKAAETERLEQEAKRKAEQASEQDEPLPEAGPTDEDLQSGGEFAY